MQARQKNSRNLEKSQKTVATKCRKVRKIQPNSKRNQEESKKMCRKIVEACFLPFVEATLTLSNHFQPGFPWKIEDFLPSIATNIKGRMLGLFKGELKIIKTQENLTRNHNNDYCDYCSKGYGHMTVGGLAYG